MADLGDDRARHKRRSSRLPWFLHRPTAAARRRSAIKIEDALREAISVAREPSAKFVGTACDHEPCPLVLSAEQAR